VALRHSADVEMQDARDWLEVFLRAGDEFVGGFGVLGVGPKYHQV